MPYTIRDALRFASHDVISSAFGDARLVELIPFKGLRGVKRARVYQRIGRLCGERIKLIISL